MFSGMNFVVDVSPDTVQISKLDKLPGGQTKTFTYPYKVPEDFNLTTTIELLKQSIIKDIITQPDTN
ncbi:hypothetical protein D3C76_1768130 [compost metagenome]